MIFEKQQIVNSSVTDTLGDLSIIGSFQIVQDAITELMGCLKTDGFTAKEKYNAIWVYTKMRIKFFRKIKWNENISIKCFISFISLVKMNLDVEVKDRAGQTVFYSRTEICALDLDTARIRKVATVGITPDMQESTPIEINFAKFADCDMPLVERVRVRSTNIDLFHHTNNLEYIRLLLNTYTVRELENKEIKEIEIAYINQSFENDLLDIKKSSFVDKDLLIIEKDEKIIVKCEILY